MFMKLALAFMMQFFPMNFLFASLSSRYIFLYHGSFSPSDFIQAGILLSF